MDEQQSPTPGGAFDYTQMVQELQKQSSMYEPLMSDLQERIARINAYSGYGTITITIAKGQISGVESQATERKTRLTKLSNDEDCVS